MTWASVPVVHGVGNGPGMSPVAVWAACHSHIRENTAPLLLDMSFDKMVSGAILGNWYLIPLVSPDGQVKRGGELNLWPFFLFSFAIILLFKIDRLFLSILCVSN